MYGPTGAALPQQVWVDSLQKYVPLYGSVADMDPSVYTAGVQYHVAFVDDSFNSAIGVASGTNDLSGASGTGYYAPISVASQAPGAYAGVGAMVPGQIIGIEEAEFLLDDVAPELTKSEWILNAVKTWGARFLALAWKWKWWFTITVGGAIVGLHLIDVIWASSSTVTTIPGCVEDGTGKCSVMTNCVTSLFGTKSCQTVNLATGKVVGSINATDTLGGVVAMIGAVAAIGLGAYIVVKVIVPALKPRTDGE